MLGRDREWEEILSVLRCAIDGQGGCGPGYSALREPAA
jgi:hypothetical protein